MSTKTSLKKGEAAPWYYQAVIKLVKPFYRFIVWRRHQKAHKQGIPIANYQDERNARFGHHFPNPPVATNTCILSSVLTDSHLDIHRVAEATELNCQKIDANPADVFTSTTIWCHAVSLGETNTIAPMLNLMLSRGAKVWLTNTTQTGFARGETLFTEAIATRQMVHTFVPVDDKKVVSTFIKHVQPDLVMFVETELWANTLAALAQNNIPSVLVNGRLSQKSFHSYQKFAAVSGSMMHNISLIIAQDVDSAKRFRLLGAAASKIRRAASLKWSTGHDITQLAQSEKAKLIAEFAETPLALERPVWVAGSTHAKEEQLLVQTQQKIGQQSTVQDTLLIIVPRHPERFDEVAKLLDESGLVVHRRSKNELITSSTQVYLVDTMGELVRCYHLADVAFVGGSLVNVGGHNPIEASRLGKPVVMGQYTQSCQELVDALKEVGALDVVQDAQNNQEVVDSLQSIVSDWLAHPQKACQAGSQGQELVVQKQTALSDQLAMIEGLLRQQRQAAQSKLDAYEQNLDLDYDFDFD